MLKIAIPLVIYFVLMFFTSFFINRKLGIDYDKNEKFRFLSLPLEIILNSQIAVAIAVFGIHSKEAFRVIGPIIEVPIYFIGKSKSLVKEKMV